MPLTERNLSICISCGSCVSGGRCRYIRRQVKICMNDSSKFSTITKLIQVKTRRDISRGIVARPLVCEECGKESKLDAHHPNYSYPNQIIFLCRSCHNKKNHECPKTIMELSELAKKRRLEMVDKKYGTTIKNLLVDFYNTPELTATDLGELMGVSRERVRQLLVEIHGKKQLIYISKRKCGVKSLSKTRTSVIGKLIYMGFEPKRISYGLFKLNNGLHILIGAFTEFAPTKGYRCMNIKRFVADFNIGYYKDSIYVYPLPINVKKTYYINGKSFDEYRDAWHLLRQTAVGL